MEKLPFFIHGMSISDQAIADNVGAEHRLPCSSNAIYFKCRSKYGGMDVSEAKRLKTLGDENAKLKRLFADA